MSEPWPEIEVHPLTTFTPTEYLTQPTQTSYAGSGGDFGFWICWQKNKENDFVKILFSKNNQQ